MPADPPMLVRVISGGQTGIDQAPSAPPRGSVKSGDRDNPDPAEPREAAVLAGPGHTVLTNQIAVCIEL